jgi:hypothetical protein
VSIAECIWPVKIVYQISLKRYNFQSLGKEQGGVEKEKGEAFNKFLREPGLPWKTFQSSSLSLSLSLMNLGLSPSPGLPERGWGLTCQQGLD